jgi:hypothetical protein
MEPEKPENLYQSSHNQVYPGHRFILYESSNQLEPDHDRHEKKETMDGITYNRQVIHGLPFNGGPLLDLGEPVRQGARAHMKEEQDYQKISHETRRKERHARVVQENEEQ